MDAITEIKIIRKIIKSKPELKNVRVTNGRGTAWGYVDITGNDPKDGYMFTKTEREALRYHFNIGTGSNFAVIVPEYREKFIQKYS